MSKTKLVYPNSPSLGYTPSKGETESWDIFGIFLAGCLITLPPLLAIYGIHSTRVRQRVLHEIRLDISKNKTYNGAMVYAYVESKDLSNRQLSRIELSIRGETK